MTTKSRQIVVGLIAVTAFAVVVILLIKGRGSTAPVTVNRIDVGAVGLGDIATLDPHLAGTALPIMIVWHMYDRLVDIGPDGQLEPMIATSWRADESLQEWTFAIRSDVHFHPSPGQNDGRRLTPEDVLVSIQRALRRPGYARTLLGDLVVGADKFIEGKADALSGLSISGDHLVFRLTRPFAYLPERLAVSFFSIAPAGSPLDSELPPPGSGPFSLQRWDRVAQHVVLRRNGAYWQPLESECPETLTFRVMESEAAAVEEVRSGGLAWLEATSTILPLLTEQQRSERMHVESIPTTTIRLVALNMERSPFREHPQLGVALNLATDRQALVAALRAGTPIGGPIPEDILQKTPHWILHNPAKARELLSDLPPDTRRLEMLVEPGHEPRIIAELLRQQWGAVGVDVNLRQGLADFFPRVIGGEYQTALGYYGPFVPSVDQYLWLCRTDAQPVPNVMRFSDARFEEAANAFTAASSTAAGPALDAALAVVAERPPAVWLIRSPRIQVTRVSMTTRRSAGIPLFHRLHLNTKGHHE